MIPSIGRTVHYVLSPGQERPAVIVRVWDEKPTEKSVVQLQVFTDGENDGLKNVEWRTSVHQDNAKAPGTWHEPERAPVKDSINDLASELCYQIERCGASEELTKASVMASDLAARLRARS